MATDTVMAARNILDSMSRQHSRCRGDSRGLPVRPAGCAALLLATACVAPDIEDLPRAPATLPDAFPEARYLQAAAAGQLVYAIDPGSSLVRVYVHRDGPLAHLGHEHVIAGREINGYVAREIGETDGAVVAEGHLYAALANMVVDDPELRAEAGFDKEISDSARLGTKSNMLESLDARQFPFVMLYVTAVLENDAVTNATVNATITLAGVTQSQTVPVKVALGRGTLDVDGKFSLRQTDFDIEPHTALGGAIAVMDRFDIEFEIRALRIDAERT